MLPPSKSEFDQKDVAEHGLEAQMHATQSEHTDHTGHGEHEEFDEHADAALDPEEEDDLGQEEPKKPKKKGMGKGAIIAAVGATVLVALCGVAYFMQGQLQSPAPVSKKIAIDPSLLEAKAAPVSPGTEITPNLNTKGAVLPSGASVISAPPPDPFGGATTAPVVPATPVVEVVTTPTSTVLIVPVPTASVNPAPVLNIEGPRADPFGTVTEKVAPKADKPVGLGKATPGPVEKVEKPVKIAKVKAVVVKIDAVDEIETVKPRIIKRFVAKRVVKKRAIVRQDMTTSEPHPSQERVQPQSNETFSGYEKLF